MSGIRSPRCASTSPTDPLVVVRADGHYLIDDRGRRLFDGTSALWCNLLGHRVPEIDAAVAEQLGRFAHTTLLGTTHPAVAELARRLVEIAPPGLNHVFFSDNGATAVEVGAEDGVSVPPAHARQRGGAATRSTSASTTRITATRSAPRLSAASSSSTTSSSRFCCRR